MNEWLDGKGRTNEWLDGMNDYMEWLDEWMTRWKSSCQKVRLGKQALVPSSDAAFTLVLTVPLLQVFLCHLQISSSKQEIREHLFYVKQFKDRLIGLLV